MLYADSVQHLKVNTTTGSILHDSIYSYFPSRAGNGVTELSVLIKTDTSGKTLWTSYPLLYPQSNEHTYFRLYKRLIKGMEGDLYGLLENNVIIKVKDSNGSVEWMRTVFNGNFDYLRDNLIDYNTEHFLYTRANYSAGSLQVFKVEKRFGRKVDSISLFMPSIGANYGGGRTYAIFRQGTNLLVATKDSCFSYGSFENPTLKWKSKHGIEFLQDVARIDVVQNQVIIFGNKYNGFQNGYITCVRLDDGQLLWTSRNQGTYDVNYADHKIRDGFLYTAWKHQYVGSTSERCLINKVNLSSGIMEWQINHSFRTQPVNVAIQEGITQLELDESFIYLTGYAQPDNYDKKSWIFMKLNQSNGGIVTKSFIENSDPDRDYPAWFTMRWVGYRLYATGFFQFRNATVSVDKQLQPASIPTHIDATIQHPSVILAIEPFSATKKIIVRRQGKQLLAEMTDPFYNTIWKYALGDTIDNYEAHPQVFVTDSSRRIYVAARRYQYLNNDFFFYPRLYTDSLFMVHLDSNGILQKRYRYDDDPQVTPLGFFQDSSRRTWRVYQSAGIEAAAPLDTVMTGPFDIVNARPYATPWRRTIFHHKADTVAMFRERGYYGGAAFTLQGPPYWYPGTVQKFLPGIKWINHVLQQDSTRYFVAAKDSSDNDVVFMYRSDSLRMEWRTTSASAFITQKLIDGNHAIWLYGTQLQQYVMRKMSKSGGEMLSDFSVSNPMPGYQHFVSSVSVSESRNRITFVGFLQDTLGVPENKLLWVQVYDTAGARLQTVIQGGFKSWQNRATITGIGQDGQTLVGGQLNDAARGYAAFLYGMNEQLLVQPDADTVFTIAPGQWNDPSIWSTGKVPTNERNVLILHPVSVTQAIICRTLTIQPPGQLQLAAGVVVELKEL